VKKKPAKKAAVSAELKRLLMAEIDNEADGGDSPVTLKSALESLKGGYEPRPGFPVARVKKELAALIGKRGNERADRFVTDADFAARKPAKKAAKKPAKKAAKTYAFETTAEVCCHRVALRYWDFTSRLTDALKDELTEHGEERAQECIIDGCSSGELNCYYVDGKKEEEIRGWWEIIRD